MRVKSALSSLALVAGLLVSGSAFGQTMINGMEIPEGELAAVQERCDSLQVSEQTESLSEPRDGEGNPQSNPDNSGSQTEEEPAVNEMANATTTIDLDTITLEACQEAGLVM